MQFNYFFSGVVNRGTRQESEFFGTTGGPAIKDHDGLEDILTAIIEHIAKQQPHLKATRDTVVLRVLIPIWVGDEENDSITFVGSNYPRIETL